MKYALFLNAPLTKCDIIIQQISFAENEIIYKTSYLFTLLCLYYNKSKVRGRVGLEQKFVCEIVITLYSHSYRMGLQATLRISSLEMIYPTLSKPKLSIHTPPVKIRISNSIIQLKFGIFHFSQVKTVFWNPTTPLVKSAPVLPGFHFE